MFLIILKWIDTILCLRSYCIFVKNVRFTGGCNGNLKAISALVEGMPKDKVIEILKGIDCRGKGTSCGDQLARALEEVK